MSEEELYHLLALQSVDGVGIITAKKLVLNFGSAENVFKAKPNELIKVDGVGDFLKKSFKDKTVFEKAEKELMFIKNNAIQTNSFLSEDYPERLKHCADGPLLLFGVGNMNLKKQRTLSIVGTRQITAYGIDFCRKLIAEIAPLNPVIVSGFAYGVDIVAHQAAVDNGLQTIGVVAHGLNQIYPKDHKKYVASMEKNGGFLSEFWSLAHPAKENFVARNRIVAGISEATVVIESAAKGGSLITANLANEYNRDVFAVPGKTTDKMSQGCNNLIKTQKANLLSSAADLIYMLNWDIKTEQKPIQKQLFIEMDNDETKIYSYLTQNGKELLDIIALNCDFPIYKISSILLTMELKGLIRPLPGKLFEAI